MPGDGRRWNVLRLVLCLALVVVLARLTILAFCGLLFACGCSWTEGIANCNIFSLQQPDCPWCSMGFAGFWSLFAGIVGLSWGTVWLAMRRLRPSLAIGLAAGLFGYWWWGTLAALGSVLYTGYPILYGIRFR